MSGKQQWRQQIKEFPVNSCGRLDGATYLLDDHTVGRVTSDRVRYVYMEDGSEVIVLGHLCDHVAFRAADYDQRLEPLLALYAAIKSWSQYGNVLPNGEIALAFHKVRAQEQEVPR